MLPADVITAALHCMILYVDKHRRASDFVFVIAQKHTEAIYNLGLMYAYDRGVGKDYLHAAMLFNEVAQPARVFVNGSSCVLYYLFIIGW